MAILLSACAPGRASPTPAPKVAAVVPPVQTPSVPGMVSPVPPTPTPTATPKQEIELPFETVEKAKGSFLPKYEGSTYLGIVSSRGEVASLQEISPKAREELNGIDYGEYFVIAVYKGLIGSLGPEVNIERVTYRGTGIKIYATFTKPLVTKDALSSPYHIVKVKRGKEVQGETEFILDVDGKELLHQTYLLR